MIAISTACYAAFQPDWNRGQIALNIIAGIGQSGPLTLLVACIQFTAPHAFLSTATGLAFSARAIGGAFGSAVLDAIINGRLSSHYEPAVGKVATAAGLPSDSLPDLFTAFSTGNIGNLTIPGVTEEIWGAVIHESRKQYAQAYRLAWSSIIPFVVLAAVAVACMRGVSELMTEKVEATVERVGEKESDKAAA